MSIRAPLLENSSQNTDDFNLEETSLISNSKDSISEDPWLEESQKTPGDMSSSRAYLVARFRKFKVLLRPLISCLPKYDMATYRPDLRKDSIRQAFLYHIPFVFSLAIILVFSQFSGFLALIVSLLWLYSLFTIGINTLEHKLIYVPEEPASARYLIESPTNYGFTCWENVELKPDGISGPTIHGYLLLQPDSDTRRQSPTILFFHGNAGNIGYRLPLCKLFSKCTKSNVFIIDYRGYGRSEGRPSEAGLAADAQSALEFLFSRADLDSTKIVVFGRSLGAAVAIELVTKPSNHDKIRSVIIENTFTSLPEMAASLFSRISFPLTKIVPLYMYSNIYPTYARFESFMKDQSAKKLVMNNSTDYVPMLFLVGDSDTLIPPWMVKRIAGVYIDHVYPNSSNDLKDGLLPDQYLAQNECHGGLVRFPNGNHNDTWLQPGWHDVITKFFENI